MKNKIYFGICIILVGLTCNILGVINNIGWLTCVGYPIELIGCINLYDGLSNIEDKFEELEKEFKKYLTNKK